MGVQVTKKQRWETSSLECKEPRKMELWRSFSQKCSAKNRKWLKETMEWSVDAVLQDVSVNLLSFLLLCFLLLFFLLLCFRQGLVIYPRWSGMKLSLSLKSKPYSSLSLSSTRIIRYAPPDPVVWIVHTCMCLYPCACVGDLNLNTHVCTSSAFMWWAISTPVVSLWFILSGVFSYTCWLFLCIHQRGTQAICLVFNQVSSLHSWVLYRFWI